MDLAKELILAVKRNNSHGGYGLQKECEALIGHVLNNMAKSKIPNLTADVKNNQIATRFREEGNQCFVTGDDEEAIEKYTQSLAFAENKESMALAFANRSAALYRKQLYGECLIDIDAAVIHGYPENKKKKLKERAQKAMEGLRQQFQAKDQNMNDLPSPSVKKDKWYTHCHHCLARSYNLIPCSKCPIAQYCSTKCKSLDWEMAHQIECSVNPVFSKLLSLDEDKIRMLTKIIRMLIICTKKGTKVEELRKDCQVAEKNQDNRTAGFTDNGTFDSKSARSALSLATNLTTRPFIDISAFACIAALAVVILAMETPFFGKKYRPKELKDIAERADVRFCGTMIFRNCVIVSSNSFSVQQEPGVKTGSGLYNAHSLMNHSCAPNTFRHFNGMTMITRALEPINEGDQIFTCYGGGYQYMARSERRSKMMQEYYFSCDCIACVDDWPTYSEILKNHIGSITKTKKELVEKLKPYRQRLMFDKYDIDAVKNVLDILYAEVKMPCEEIVHAIQYLKSYYLGKFNQQS
ncbi:hypothetical protein QAD02_001768 [Eretmocerus hayati]|uniref:Uncharacterized protein n=1 Tax=Eretmocerus hayati TaxID=131215 RepID=A0ACC2NGY8_9HYME|nr:hypothetical protein QAD02_001768 [Eretmocerus hayati]